MRVIAMTTAKVTATCLRCNGLGKTQHLASCWRSPFDPDNASIRRHCGACDGAGSIEVMVEEDDPDLIHDATVDAINARGFRVDVDDGDDEYSHEYE